MIGKAGVITILTDVATTSLMISAMFAYLGNRGTWQLVQLCGTASMVASTLVFILQRAFLSALFLCATIFNDPTTDTPDGPQDTRSPFQKFQDFTRRILTTPKAEVMKHAPKHSKGKKK